MIIQLKDDKYAVIVSYKLLKIIVALFGTRTGINKKFTREESSNIYYEGFDLVENTEGKKTALNLGRVLINKSDPKLGFTWETSDEV